MTQFDLILNRKLLFLLWLHLQVCSKMIYWLFFLNCGDMLGWCAIVRVLNMPPATGYHKLWSLRFQSLFSWIFCSVWKANRTEKQDQVGKSRVWGRGSSTLSQTLSPSCSHRRWATVQNGAVVWAWDQDGLAITTNRSHAFESESLDMWSDPRQQRIWKSEGCRRPGASAH